MPMHNLSVAKLLIRFKKIKQKELKKYSDDLFKCDVYTLDEIAQMFFDEDKMSILKRENKDDFIFHTMQEKLEMIKHSKVRK